MDKFPCTSGNLHSESWINSQVADIELKSSKDMFQWFLTMAGFSGKWGFDTKVYRGE